MLIEIPAELQGPELFKFLRENKKQLIAQKKAVTKHFDSPGFLLPKVIDPKTGEAKTIGVGTIPDDADRFNVKAAANTSLWCDSYMDVLLRDSGKKSIRERKGLIPIIHDHQYTVDAEIGEVNSIYYQDVSLKELGYKGDGMAQALVFDFDAIKEYNPVVFKKYKDGRIKQHSIGLRYIRIEMAINSEEKWYEDEKKEWDKHFEKIINKEVAEERGYFWAVYEYVLLENSCVLIGANQLTPTLEINENKSTSHQVQPLASTEDDSEEKEDDFDLDAAIAQTKFII